MAETKYDVEGYDVITSAVIDLLNAFPGLLEDEKVNFSMLNEDGGITMFTASGAVIDTERKYIDGGVYQLCRYPFTVYYRVAGQSESRKVAVKEWLDNLGRWLEGQPVTINGTVHQLTNYPTLADGWRFTEFRRQTPAYLESIDTNHIENWVISAVARYEHEFKKMR